MPFYLTPLFYWVHNPSDWLLVVTLSETVTKSDSPCFLHEACQRYTPSVINIAPANKHMQESICRMSKGSTKWQRCLLLYLSKDLLALLWLNSQKENCLIQLWDVTIIFYPQAVDASTSKLADPNCNQYLISTAKSLCTTYFTLGKIKLK